MIGEIILFRNQHCYVADMSYIDGLGNIYVLCGVSSNSINFIVDQSDLLTYGYTKIVGKECELLKLFIYEE